MFILNEKGVVTPIIIVLLLLGGLVSGLYLTQNTQIFAPKAFDRVSSDSKSAARTPSQCKVRLNSFTLNQPCDEVSNGFKSAKFSCTNTVNGVAVQQPDQTIAGEKCRPAAELLSEALRACRNTCSQISPTPPVCVLCAAPPPGCSYIGGTCESCGTLACKVDDKCLVPPGIPLPSGCPVPTTTPTSEPTACAAVITSARNPKTGECKDFPSPCDVLVGWEKVEKC